MSKLRSLRAKNAMLLANFISNAIGVSVIHLMPTGVRSIPSLELIQVVNRISYVFTPLAFIVPVIITLIYEKPIRLYLTQLFKSRPITSKAAELARRRLLNEPFFMIGMDFVIWLVAAVIFTIALWMQGASPLVIQESFFHSILTGLITVTIAFFVLEFIMQRRVVHFFFPKGGLSTTPGTLRIRIRTRLVALWLAINIIPLLAVYSDIIKSTPKDLVHVQAVVSTQILLFSCVGAWLIFLVSSNFTKPLQRIVDVLHCIKNGDFKSKVRVTSNDEIGYTGDIINEMADGLLEREKLQQSLRLAREVQQNLLPKKNLILDGYEIAGRSVYCDETGGDYYDFIPLGNGRQNKIGIVIGDVAGHGISSALLMATVRSALRQGISLSGSPAKIISAVNRQLAFDVEDSGQFMTMFYLNLDTKSHNFTWVRAGHDPAIVYDPHSDLFTRLDAPGIALGVDGDWRYEQNEQPLLSNGQIVLLGTDGIWEVRNQAGEMLGKTPIMDIIRQNATATATQILDAIFDRLESHVQGAKIEDDITAVIIKSRT